MDSWRLALWAEQQGSGEELLAAVGRRYFEEAQPLADRSMLLSAVEEAGLDRGAAQAVLDGDAFRSEVLEHYRWATEDLGIRSIPVFLISDASGSFRTTVRGSASIEDFSKVLSAAAVALTQQRR
mmetsp:Transcript_7812/g.28560  ORF Transcript_7812/g.28560 Transcript_7812/m.28560 type:complete len:125 (+) Transcript_7812:433-807(+)